MHLSKYSTFQSSFVFHSGLSDPFVKLSDVEGKPLDILSDLSETEVSFVQSAGIGV